MAKAKTGKNGNGATVTIAPPNLKVAVFIIEGTAPYVQNKFSAKASQIMKERQEAGGTAKKGKKRERKDFQAIYKAAQHISREGWNGIPAPAFRAAMVSACRICGFQMTRAKLAIFIEADGEDEDDQTPLVKFTRGEPEYTENHVRLETGVIDIRPRPMWRAGWRASVRVRFDADMFTIDDVSNLFMRVGMQVGIGEGRPDSRKSCGMGWGTFKLVNHEEV